MTGVTAVHVPNEAFASARRFTGLRAFGVIFLREIAERKMALWACLALGIVLLLLPVLPHLRPQAEAVWTLAPLYLGIPVGIGLALYGGASFVAAELRERRLTFFMSKPAPIVAILGGKLFAAATLGFFGMLLVMLPASFTGKGLIWLLSDAAWDTSMVLLSVAVAITVAVPLGHAAGIAFRSRSPWLLLDLSMLASLGIVVWTIAQSLLLVFALGLLGMIILSVWAALVPVMGIAGYLGFAEGRTDLRSTHARQSLVAAIGVALIMAGVLTYAEWARSAEPQDLHELRLVSCAGWNCPPIVLGKTPWRVDLETLFIHWKGNTIRPVTPYMVAGSGDGNRLAWIAPLSIEPPVARIMWQDQSDSQPRETKIELDSFMTSSIALSSEGSLLAVATDDLLQIIALDQERVLRSVKLSDAPSYLRFLVDDRILAVRSSRAGEGPFSATLIEEITVEGQRRDPIRLKGLLEGFDPAAGVVITRQGDDYTLYSTDGWKEVLTTSAKDALLFDDHLLLARSAPARLELLRSNGGPVRVFPLDASIRDISFSAIAGELAVMAVSRKGQIGHRLPSENLEVLTVNLASGETRPIAKGLLPAREPHPYIAGPFFTETATEGARLVRLDPQTGGRTVIAGMGAGS